MGIIYNVYCDESCHLERDGHTVMAFGAIWCPDSDKKRHSIELRKIKNRRHARGELKWSKVSRSRTDYFIELVDYLFHSENLNYRCLIVDDKSKLNHVYFNHGSHDSFYYKMYFYLLKNIITTVNHFNIYLDIKDTRSQNKIDKLTEILRNSFYDSDRNIIRKIQHVRSDEVELLQLADFFTGAISYFNRNLTSNPAKLAVIERIQANSGLNLSRSTPPWYEKFNLFLFSPMDTTK